MIQWFIFFALNVTMLAYTLLLSLAAAPAAVSSKPTILDSIANASSSPLVHYPTQLTQGIVPKQIHSHNDCTQSSSSRLTSSTTKPVAHLGQTGGMSLCSQP